MKNNIYNQVRATSNHMHLVQLSLLYIPKGIRLKGDSFYKLHNGDQTTNNHTQITQPASIHVPGDIYYNRS